MKSDAAKELGLDSQADVVSEAVRVMLKKYGYFEQFEVKEELP